MMFIGIETVKKYGLQAEFGADSAEPVHGGNETELQGQVMKLY